MNGIERVIEQFQKEIETLNKMPVNVNKLDDVIKAVKARETAIFAMRELQQYRQIGTLEHVQEFDTLYLEKCQEVNELRKQTQWIPVEERLPEESGYYCVTTKNTVDGNRIEQTAWFAHKDDYYADESVWREIQSYEKVVAWRKSKPYNPESPQESPCNDAGWRQRMLNVFLGGKTK